MASNGRGPAIGRLCAWLQQTTADLAIEPFSPLPDSAVTAAYAALDPDGTVSLSLLKWGVALRSRPIGDLPPQR